jgi:hypothetical protein
VFKDSSDEKTIIDKIHIFNKIDNRPVGVAIKQAVAFYNMIDGDPNPRNDTIDKEMQDFYLNKKVQLQVQADVKANPRLLSATDAYVVWMMEETGVNIIPPAPAPVAPAPVAPAPVAPAPVAPAPVAPAPVAPVPVLPPVGLPPAPSTPTPSPPAPTPSPPAPTPAPPTSASIPITAKTTMTDREVVDYFKNILDDTSQSMIDQAISSPMIAFIPVELDQFVKCSESIETMAEYKNGDPVNLRKTLEDTTAGGSSDFLAAYDYIIAQSIAGLATRRMSTIGQPGSAPTYIDIPDVDKELSAAGNGILGKLAAKLDKGEKLSTTNYTDAELQDFVKKVNNLMYHSYTEDNYQNKIEFTNEVIRKILVDSPTTASAWNWRAFVGSTQSKPNKGVAFDFIIQSAPAPVAPAPVAPAQPAPAPPPTPSHIPTGSLPLITATTMTYANVVAYFRNILDHKGVSMINQVMGDNAKKFTDPEYKNFREIVTAFKTHAEGKTIKGGKAQGTSYDDPKILDVLKGKGKGKGSAAIGNAYAKIIADTITAIGAGKFNISSKKVSSARSKKSDKLNRQLKKLLSGI